VKNMRMKKAMKIGATLLLLGVIGAAVALALTPRQKLEAYVTPDVRYVTVANAEITDTTLVMDVQLEVTSKWLPVFVDSLIYDFRLADTTVAAGSKKFAADTKNGQVQTLLIPVALDLQEAQAMAQRQLLQGNKLQARVQAYCQLPLVGIKRFDFNRDVDLAIPVIPGAELLLNQF
jgi:LEA14-like dessication related protein